MFTLHYGAWPEGRPYHLPPLETSVFDNLAATVERTPNAVAIQYYGSTLSYASLLQHVERIAGMLMQRFDVQRGEPVLLFMQNSPQYIIGYYAILRANAAIVPVNPMIKQAELTHIASETGARVILFAHELLDVVSKVISDADNALTHAVHTHYADYIKDDTDLTLPDVLLKTNATTSDLRKLSWLFQWDDAINEALAPASQVVTPQDWCVIPFSSGTTGQPKGCVHTHASVNAVINAYMNWFNFNAEAVTLACLPLFHVIGMQNSMNLCIRAGCTIVVMTRWNRDVAAALIERYRVTHWRSITTMAIDFFSNPNIDQLDLSSLRAIGGGGAQMPKAVADTMKRYTGLDYVEGYGLSETISATHINPPQAPRPQCLGIPIFDVDSRIVDPQTLLELGVNETGEILLHGPQILTQYLNQPAQTAKAFIELDGKRFFRTGDLGFYDETGFFYFVDRLKRMVNVSGFKVWPAEIEAIMHGHPDIEAACVISKPDVKQGESVKAVVVKRAGTSPDEQMIINWCHENMARYKVPATVSFVDSLPKSHTGKVLWRVLQEAEKQIADDQH